MPRIQHKRGTSTNLTAANPTPLAGELVWDSTENSIKIGTGSTAWTSLAYVTATPRSHKSQHATGGSDALTPSDIGAAPAASPAITGNATFEASSGVPVTITNTGSGNSFVVNDASGDTSPFLIDASGNIEAGPNKRTIGVSSRMHISADNANWGTPFCAVCDSTGRGPVFVSADYSPNPDVGSQLYINASTGGFTIGCTSPGNSASGSVTFAASQVVTPAGTAAAPALVSGTGTADTGVFWPAADTVAISTAGVERVRVRSDGNVGIGSAGGSNAGLWLQPTLSSASDRYGIYGRITGTTDSTSPIYTCSTFADLQSSASTSLAVNYQAIRPQLAAGASVTTAVGMLVQSSFTVATNNYGVQLSIGSGSGRWNIYADGTAANYFAGNVGIGSGTTSPTAALDINSDKIRLRTAKTPASASDAGNAGDICWDASYLYICTATNTWRRIAHSTW